MKIKQLLEHHGIARNPFAEEDAQTDPVFKGHCIDNTYHPTWDKIYGDPAEPATAIVFGEKGAGKTAMRLQIAWRLEEYNAEHPGQRLFVIHYDDFNHFLDTFRDKVGPRRKPEKLLHEWKLWDHMDAILTLGVRRLVRECIRAGIAGVRIDDQPIEGKRRTQSAGVEVVPLEQAVARYRAAVDMRNELDPDFVVMAQCYARDAANGGLDDCLRRLQAYRRDAGADWVQFESPHSQEEIKRARAAFEGPFSFMKGKLPRYLTLDEHLALGVNIAWYPAFTHHVTWAALWDFMQEFQKRGVAAWDDFTASRKDRPYPVPDVGPQGEGAARQRELEERYFPADALKKYRS